MNNIGNSTSESAHSTTTTSSRIHHDAKHTHYANTTNSITRQATSATNTTPSNNNSNYVRNADVAQLNIKLLFDQFDKDNDGKISKNELRFVMCNLFPDEVITDEDINEMLQAADLDRNGFIEFDGTRCCF